MEEYFRRCGSFQAVGVLSGRTKSNDLDLLNTYRGNFSASRTTVLMPSRAKTEAAYEPAGPPPMTSTVHLCGISIEDESGRISEK